jgi:tetratricopeptide (TPR) repeat protein
LQHRYQEALEAYQTATAFNAKFAAAWFNQGVVLSQLQRYTEAIVAYESALGLCPQFSEAWFQRGQLLEQLHQPQEALLSYETAIQTNQSWGKASLGQAWNHQAQCLLQLDRPQDALVASNHAFRLEPENVAVQQQRVLVLQRLGQWQAQHGCAVAAEAKAAWEQDCEVEGADHVKVEWVL